MEGECREGWFRNQIFWLNFLFSLLVVWVHSKNGELFLGTGKGAWVQRLENWICDSVGQIAVPGFFMVSAYLFYRGLTWKKIPYKWKSRFFSLVLPYILWNFLYYMGYWISGRIPGLAELVGKGKLPFDLATLVDAVIWYRYNPVFWYLLQLILLVLLAPALYIVLKGRWMGAVAIALAVYGLWRAVVSPFLNLDAMFYYMTGAYAALHRDGMTAFLEQKPGGEAGWKHELLMGVTLAAAVVFTLIFGKEGRFLWNHPLYTVLLRFEGVCTVILLLRLIPLPQARDFMKRTFFLYAVHFAGVRLVNKTAALMFSGSKTVALVLFFAMPGLMTVAAWTFGKALETAAPAVYRILAGKYKRDGRPVATVQP